MDKVFHRFYISSVTKLTVLQGCQGQGKYLENDFFQVREKSGNCKGGQGNLRRTWKVREIDNGNGYGRQSSENLFILFKRAKDVLSQI